MDYKSIKAAAKEMGCRVADLIALAGNNDPFFADVPARKHKGEWFGELWHRFGWRNGVHLRRLHYVLISTTSPIMKPDGTPYFNTIGDWKMLVGASLAARYLRLIPAAALVDKRNPDPMIFAANGVIAGAPAEIYLANRSPMFSLDLPRFDADDMPDAPLLLAREPASGQPYLVEVWSEKSTMDDVLVPVCRRLGVNYVPGMGETSEILARQAVERAVDAARPMRILYISDFDPGGRSMPVALARKVEFLLRDADLDLDITLQPIALTPEQCEHYRLPRTPIKETERRAPKFEERFGSGATELDALEALHPGELARIVEREICRYIDTSLSSRVQAAWWRMHQHLREITAEVHGDYAEELALIGARYDLVCQNIQAAIDQAEAEMERIEQGADPLWQAIAERLEELMPHIELEAPPAAKEADPPDEPLFDSSRSYLEQLDYYRDWQGR
ncbi:hypothetical protein GOD34_18355 [Sinorhizobium medicae]|uniref:hypothetical protein n=1 Tax=Sinorhizobium medicae TaxID=110321 RepID=UPI000FDA2E42|nr:hypothetical protein [Sinorhizobium medicae]MDX0438933.1 hypothetical protein [Sinorhizobium medicae]MDX0652729.1 hypothetical protein [Sinorhizobium medicae]MDX1156597.1 hypothetical protein [Sinorhizobium medicae]RVJ10228.1 hypothetical protein CN181_11220 [Sinorhizobium medicae]